MNTMSKIVFKNGVFMAGRKEIGLSEIRELSTKGELMVLGRCNDTDELLWEEAPGYELIENIDTFYHVPDPSKRIQKSFPARPVNFVMPCSFFECRYPIEPDNEMELAELEKSLNDDIDIYYEVADKSGEVFRSGVCRHTVIGKIRAWAAAVSGSCYIEQYC